MRVLGIVVGCASQYVPVAKVEALEQRVLALEKLCADLDPVVRSSKGLVRKVNQNIGRIEQLNREIQRVAEIKRNAYTFSIPNDRSDWYIRLRQLRLEQGAAELAFYKGSPPYSDGDLYVRLQRAKAAVFDHLANKPTKQRTVNEAATNAARDAWHDIRRQLELSMEFAKRECCLIEQSPYLTPRKLEFYAHLVSVVKLHREKLEAHLKTSWEIHYND